MLLARLKRILGSGRLRLPVPNGANDEFLLPATARNLRKLAKFCPAPQQTRKARQERHLRPDSGLHFCDGNSVFFHRISSELPLAALCAKLGFGYFAPYCSDRDKVGFCRHLLTLKRTAGGK